jgi:hypothetical protein
VLFLTRFRGVRNRMRQSSAPRAWSPSSFYLSHLHSSSPHGRPSTAHHSVLLMTPKRANIVLLVRHGLRFVRVVLRHCKVVHVPNRLAGRTLLSVPTSQLPLKQAPRSTSDWLSTWHPRFTVDYLRSSPNIQSRPGNTWTKLRLLAGRTGEHGTRLARHQHVVESPRVRDGERLTNNESTWP